MFQRMNVPIQIDEVRYTQIQSLLQKEKPNTNDIKKLFDDLINYYDLFLSFLLNFYNYLKLVASNF